MRTSTGCERLNPAAAFAYVLLALATPGALPAQAAIVLQAGQAPTAATTPSAHLVVPVLVDMDAARGADLAALTATATWNQKHLTLDSVAAGNFGTLTSNATAAASGRATFSVFGVTGTLRTVTVARLFFTATALTGASDIAVTPTVAGNEVGRAILPLVKSRALRVCVSARPAPCAAD